MYKLFCCTCINRFTDGKRQTEDPKDAYLIFGEISQLKPMQNNLQTLLNLLRNTNQEKYSSQAVEAADIVIQKKPLDLLEITEILIDQEWVDPVKKISTVSELFISKDINDPRCYEALTKLPLGVHGNINKNQRFSEIIRELAQEENMLNVTNILNIIEVISDTDENFVKSIKKLKEAQLLTPDNLNRYLLILWFFPISSEVYYKIITYDKQTQNEYTTFDEILSKYEKKLRGTINALQQSTVYSVAESEYDRSLIIPRDEDLGIQMSTVLKENEWRDYSKELPKVSSLFKLHGIHDQKCYDFLDEINKSEENEGYSVNLARITFALSQVSHMLTSANINRIRLAGANLNEEMANGIARIHKKGILTQGNFDKIIRIPKSNTNPSF